MNIAHSKSRIVQTPRTDPGRRRAKLLEFVDSALGAVRHHHGLVQFGLYSFVGGICFSIDILGFIIFLHCGIAILTASALSFVTATISNYLLCCILVFRSGRFSRHVELLRVFGIAIVGLTLNTAVLWLLAEFLGVNPLVAKILAVLPVLAWNYHGRRLFVFDGAPAPAMMALVDRVRARL